MMFYFDCRRFAILERFFECEKKSPKKRFHPEKFEAKNKGVGTTIRSDVLFLTIL